VLAEDRAHRVCNLADGGFCLDRGDNRRHEVAAGARRLRDPVERRAPLVFAPAGADRADAFDLLALDIRVDGEERLGSGVVCGAGDERLAPSASEDAGAREGSAAEEKAVRDGALDSALRSPLGADR